MRETWDTALKILPSGSDHRCLNLRHLLFVLFGVRSHFNTLGHSKPVVLKLVSHNPPGEVEAGHLPLKGVPRKGW